MNVKGMGKLEIAPSQIHVKCPCGQKDYFGQNKFEINIVGLLEFKCDKCGKIQRTPGLWC